MPRTGKRTRQGKWRVAFRGTRVPVSSVLRNLEDLSIDEVVQEYPAITRDQVQTVLAFVVRSADPIFLNLMLVLLEENLPHRLRLLISGHDL